MDATERNCAAAPRREAGFSLLEVLVTLLILTIGLLGLAGLQVQAQRAGQESYQRAQALIILNDIVDRINTNRAVATCYAITDLPASGTKYLGSTAGGGHYDTTAYDCPSILTNPGAVARAGQDLKVIDGILRGAAESASVSGASVGAMIGARACIGFDGTTQTYSVAVAWQGLASTFSPLEWLETKTPATARNCAKTQYGSSDTLRRVVWSTLLVANLK